MNFESHFDYLLISLLVLWAKVSRILSGTGLIIANGGASSSLVSSARGFDYFIDAFLFKFVGDPDFRHSVLLGDSFLRLLFIERRFCFDLLVRLCLSSHGFDEG